MLPHRSGLRDRLDSLILLIQMVPKSFQVVRSQAVLSTPAQEER